MSQDVDADLPYDAHDSPTWRAEVALVKYLRSKQLSGIAEDDAIGRKVYSRLFADDSTVQFPCVFVAQERLTEAMDTPADTNHQLWVPFAVVIADKCGPRKHQRKRQYLRWRWELMQAFDRRTDAIAYLKATEPSVWAVEVQPGQIIYTDETYDHVFSQLTVRIGLNVRKAAA